MLALCIGTDIILIIALFIVYYCRIKPYVKNNDGFLWLFWAGEIFGLIFVGISSRVLAVFIDIYRFPDTFYMITRLPIIAITLFNYTVCAVSARKNEKTIKLVTIIAVNAVIAVLEIAGFFVYVLFVLY